MNNTFDRAEKSMNILYTPEGEKLQKKLSENQENFIPLSEYPRPTLKRKDSHIILNGTWDFSPCNKGESPSFYKKILVPFSPESLLSGIGTHYSEGTELCYRKIFSIPEGFNKGRIILHFGAVDQKATVFVNEKKVGEHIGGYTPFSFDVTEFIRIGENSLKVIAIDDLNDKSQPYGKQRIKRKGMWYTPVSGIWQTVWLETVPEKYVKSVETKTLSNRVEIKLNDSLRGSATLKTKSDDKETEILKIDIENGFASFEVPSPVYWCPENPHLYYLDIIIYDSDENACDKVETYFALRTLEIKKVHDVSFLFLNGKPYFFHGLLDQGYWSDGIYTPASYQCFIDDILMAKSLGFNTLRKHIKLEPERFYYECDRLGMVVFQDMINNGSYSFIRDTALPTIGLKRLNDKNLHKDKKTREEFKKCAIELMKTLKKHPSVCLWTIFNEGWGQFDGNNMYDFVKKIDDSRFIDTASGWFHCSNSDVESIHKYFSKYKHKKNEKPVFLSEFGGYSYKLNEHSFNLDNTYGYGKITSKEQFDESVFNLYVEQIIPAIKDGLSADVYTQLSDVEDETNGMITYDRKVLKISKDKMLSIKKKIDDEIEKITLKIN